MKKFKLLSMIAAGALTLAMGAFAFAGCAKGTDYTFEAEEAVTEGNGTAADQSQAPASVETNVVWTEDGAGGAEVMGLGGFNAVGQKIIWTVVSASACEVTVTIHAASAQMEMDETFNLKGLAEVDLGNSEVYKMTVNDTAVTLSGKLPATAVEGGWNGMNTPGLWWHMGTASATANLKAGENVIVFEIVGAASQMGSGVNVDKIVVNSTSELTEKK